MKILKLITALLILSFSSFVYAEEESDFTSPEEQVTLQEVSKDFSNKVIISLFGYRSFERMSKKEIISNNLTREEVKSAIAPLPYIFPYLLYIYSIISAITILVFVIYLSYIVYESFIKTQNSGNFLGQGNNTTFFFIKIFLVLLLIFPISETKNDIKTKEFTTPIQIFLLKTFSLSNDMGKKITNSYISSQPKLYPEIKYIGSDSLDAHEDIGVAILDYHMCLKRYNFKPKYKFYKTSEKLIIESTSDKENSYISKCNISISYPLDSANKNIVNNRKEVSDMIKQLYPLDDNYLTTKEKEILSDPENNEEAYKRYETTLISSYIDFHIRLNREIEKSVNVILSPTNDNKTNINTASDLKELLLYKNLIPSDYWYKDCDNIINYNGDPLTIEEKQYYTNFVSKCISEKYAKKITFKNITDFQEYLSEDNYLNNYHLNLCTHNFNSNDGEVTNIEFNYDLDNEYLEASASEPILNCISNECSNIDSEFSNVYTCSSALSLYSSYNEEKKLSNIGFISIAPIMYRSFVNFSNNNSRKLFNDIKIEDESILSNLEKLDEIEELNYTIIDKSKAELEYSKIFFNSRSIRNNNAYINDVIGYGYLKNTGTSYSEIIESNTKIKKTHSTFNPLNRLTTCIENPNKISKGYICGSVPQEYNRFGSMLIKLYSTAVILRTAIKSMQNLSEYNNDFNYKKSGIKQKTSIKKIKATGAGLGLTAMFLFSDIDQIRFILNSNEEENTESDAFSGHMSDINDFQNKMVNDPTFEGFGSIDMKESSIIVSVALVYAMLPENIYKILAPIFDIFVLILGIFIGYVIPLIPYWLFLIVLSSYFSLLLVRFIILPILAIFIMEPSQSHQSSALKNIIIMFAEVLFKIPLIIVGIILSWVLTNNIISKVFTLFDIESIFSLQNPAFYLEALIFIITAIIYTIVLFVLTNLTMTIIQTFYDFSTDWFKGQTKDVIGNTSNTSNMQKTQQLLKLKIKNKK
tara:strand:+ start:103895 stop:106837 length:2943 start_codon:yes stop_codon:yes gene_type:complete